VVHHYTSAEESNIGFAGIIASLHLQFMKWALNVKHTDVNGMHL
jgi:hypothetical protein